MERDVNKAALLAAVSALGLSLGVTIPKTALADESPKENHYVKGESQQIKYGNQQIKGESQQLKYGSGQIKGESNQIKYGGQQIKGENNQIKYGSQQIKDEGP
jgi:hypothetical protein